MRFFSWQCELLLLFHHDSDKVQATNGAVVLEIGKLVISSEMYKRKSSEILSGYENVFMLE